MQATNTNTNTNTNKNANKNAVAAAVQQQAPQQQAQAPQQQAQAPQAQFAPQSVNAAHVTVQQHSALRAARLQAVQVAYRAKHLAARKQASAAATQAALQNSLLAQVQALYAQHGMQAPTQALRSVPQQQKHPQSIVKGACATVRAYVHANPQATCAQVKQHFAGTVNPATVQTQYQLAKKGKQ